MQNIDKLIFVGFISSCSGIKGDVIIKSYTQNAVDICKLSLYNSDGLEVNLKLIRLNSKGDLICKLNNIDNRNEAEKWLKQKLFCLRSTLPRPPEDEFYIEDLKNMEVISEAGDKLGTVLGVYNFGAGDVIEIELMSKKTIMLPFNNNFFPEVTDKYVVCTKVDNN